MTKSKSSSNSARASTGGLDDTDRKIMSMLIENPKMSQAEISERLQISQPAVSLRVRKLEEKGVLAHLIGTDIKKAELFLAKVDITTNRVEQLLEILNKCPLYLNCFLTSGKHNMTCLMLGENIKSIMSVVDSRLRQNLPAESIEFDLIVTPTRPMVVPLKPQNEKKEISPCGADCSVCTFYTSDKCLGCPASVHYKGSLL
jgi:Lrp/AsnC family leucine-responsive transcriptional regulator